MKRASKIFKQNVRCVCYRHFHAMCIGPAVCSKASQKLVQQFLKKIANMARKFSIFWTRLLNRISKIPYIDLGFTSGMAST